MLEVRDWMLEIGYWIKYSTDVLSAQDFNLARLSLIPCALSIERLLTRTSLSPTISLQRGVP